MKKLIKTIKTIATVGVMLVCAFRLGNKAASSTVNSQQRIITGNYYDYMVIETVDGKEWLLDDTEDSPYIENGISVFEDGELVQVVFDTLGTESVKDDVIVEVGSINKMYK